MIMDATVDLGVIYIVHLFPISARLNKFFILSFVHFSVFQSTPLTFLIFIILLSGLCSSKMMLWIF